MAVGEVRALAAALDALAALDPHALADAALVEGLAGLHAAESRLRAVQAGWLAAAEAREATVGECGRAARSWLVEECRLGPAEASRRLRLARGLRASPVLAGALGAGAVTAEHAGVILRAVGELPGDAAGLRAPVEAALVELARALPPFLVARGVDEVLARVGAPGAAEAAAAGYARRYADRGVELDLTFGGFGSLAGTLAPEAAEALRLALDAAAATAGPEDRRPARQRRHDGLAEIAQFYLAHADLAETAGARPRVVVTISLDALLDRLPGQGGLLDSGAPVGAETARRLACDAGLLPAVLGGRGELLDLGRGSRVFNRAIRRAVTLRDGFRCAYPGCRRRPAELHHIRWWSHGGTTCLDNAGWLCCFHHWLVHEGGWAMRRAADGGYTFTRPDGQARGHPRHPRHPRAA